DHGISDVTNTPAVYTMYQRFAFLPLNQPFLTVNRNNQVSTWADPDYAPYQWADTNGDGMADARWFELTAARDPNSGSTNERDDIERLYDAGNFRVFAAARVVDLSSMVNVNTATDQLAMPEPDLGAPMGATPAEVDLRRLLSMSDAAENYSISNPLSGASLSPSQWHRPRGSRLNPSQNFPEQIRDDDYFYYLSFIDRNLDPKIVKPHSTSLNVGRYAYDAIKRGIEQSTTLDERYFAWPPEIQNGFGATPAPATPADFDTVFNSPALNADDTNPSSIYRLDPFFESVDDAFSRKEYYEKFGTVDPTIANAQSGSATPQSSALYNNDDLFELLAFHGLNDPSRISRLEKNAMGRMPSIFQQNQRAFSPLFSNRELQFDRFQHGYVEENGYTIAGGYPIDPDPNAIPRRIEGSIAKESMAFFATSPRRLLTTVSGASHIKPGDLILTGSPTIGNSAAPVLSSALGNVNTLFDIYSNALASELDISKLEPSLDIDDLYVLDPTTTRSDAVAGSSATLFYGHRGPELALRIAAHSAVNMKDLNDVDQEPSAATLILDETSRDVFLESEMYDSEDPDTTAYSHYAGRATNTVLNPGGASSNVVPDNAFSGDQDHRKVVNVFGIEPMPFLTEMTSMYVYTDSVSEQGGADGTSADDASPSAPSNRGPFTQFPNPLVEVTINGDVVASNNDLKLQVIAFQLTNPWSEDIVIGGGSGPMGYIDEEVNSPVNTNLQFEYYIEFGGRFFKIGEYVEFNPSLNAGDTIGLYGDAEDPSSPAVNTVLNQATHEEYQYQGVTIPANSARVFYAIANSRFLGEDGVSGVDPEWLKELGDPTEYTDVVGNDPDSDGFADGRDGQDWTGPAREWIDRQFRTRGGLPPVHIHQFDPRDGKLVEEGEFHDLMLSPMTPVFTNAQRTHDHTQARLWRKITGSLEESIEDPLLPGQIRENIIQNDMLVDRLELPSGESLDRSLPGGNQAIEGSFGYDTSAFPRGSEASIGARNDNYGLTMARWATVRRLDGAPEARDYESGQIGAWMLSSRTTPDDFTNFSHDPVDEGDDGDLDIADFLDNSLTTLSDPEFFATDAKEDYEVDRSFSEFWNNVFASSRREIVQTIVRAPDQKWRITDDPTTPLPLGIDFDIRFPNKEITSNSNGDILHGTDSDLIPELLPNARGFNGTPRLTDLLLAWGIGPTYTPDPARNFDDVSFDDTTAQGLDEGLRWMTVAESLAIGLGLETVNVFNASESAADNIWYEAIGTNGDVLDNGHLAIDRFVAYYNTDTSEVVPEFDTLNDIRRGTGIPMALGVLDQARPLPLPTTTPPSTDPFELLKTPTFGLININTAPPEVLRLLPGLSPSRTQHYPDNQSTLLEDEWWANNDSNSSLLLPNLSAPSDTSFPPTNPQNRTPDVAATLAAYRDRHIADSRFMSTQTLPISAGNPIRYFTRPTDSALVGENFVREQTAIERSLTNDFRDRASIAGVDGLRSTPGFASMGEVLMATIGPDAIGANLNGGSAPLITHQMHLDIQQYGKDTVQLDGGSTYNDVAIDPQLFGGTENGGTADDYAERLAMASGILNTISVRSDYYAVWFVVHAYQESDVTNLQPEDPLVPSLAKRYVMVIDRTNVIDQGDTPRIVFLKEVPM
ncbi:MAG: hypothetical protein JJ974_10865, partial [Phycisphaerales bacterium]|nr:hypothetical protein [Phycisphaerales bacterium]